jgi:uncharacterized protein YndB with AHSA1/START domain
MSVAPHQTIEPVRKTIEVKCPQEHAFRVFTERMNAWWPRATHSIGGAQTVSCAIEGRVGGRIYEVLANGDQVAWGRVITWDPPRRLVISWHLAQGVETASEVEVKFSPAGPGATRVELEHRNWERFGGEKARERRDNYDKGWGVILTQNYAKAAENPT